MASPKSPFCLRIKTRFKYDFVAKFSILFYPFPVRTLQSLQECVSERFMGRFDRTGSTRSYNGQNSDCERRDGHVDITTRVSSRKRYQRLPNGQVNRFASKYIYLQYNMQTRNTLHFRIVFIVNRANIYII